MSSLDLINRPWQAWKLEGTTLVPGELDSLNKLRTRELRVCKAGGSALGERYRRAAPRCAKVQPWNNCSQACKGLFLSLLQTNPWQVTGSGSCPQTSCWMRSRCGWPWAYWQQRALCEARVAFGWKEFWTQRGVFVRAWVAFAGGGLAEPPCHLAPEHAAPTFGRAQRLCKTSQERHLQSAATPG